MALSRTLRVLVIDDHEPFGQTMESVLGGLGCEVDVAFTPFAGITLSDSTRYDLVLVDFRMPQMDGLECLRLLQPRGHRCMLLVTGYGGDVSTGEVQEAGGQGILAKPLDVQHLVEIMRYVAQSGTDAVSLPERLWSASTGVVGLTFP